MAEDLYFEASYEHSVVPVDAVIVITSYLVNEQLFGMGLSVICAA